MCVIDSVQTLYAPELTGAPGSVGQVREVAGRLMRVAKERRCGDRARRPRDQGGLAGRAARARAPRRLRPAVRGRARAHLPHAAGAEEPLRVHERGRRLRDARRRPGGGRRTPRRASSPRPRRAPGIGGPRARWRAHGRCSSRCRRWSLPRSSCRPAGWRTASTATGSRSILAVLVAPRRPRARIERRLRVARRRREGGRAGRGPRDRAGRLPARRRGCRSAATGRSRHSARSA